MKRVFTLLFIVISAISSASAQLAQLDDGYYRIQCVETGRYISFRNNYVDEESFLRSTESQFYPLRTISGFENVVNDPGSVIYLKKHEQGWTLCSQDYDFDFYGSFFQITDMGDGSYSLWATYSKSGVTVTRYMRDCDDSSGGFSYVTTQEDISKGWNWRLIPVTADDQKYIGLVPEVKVGGKGYATFYAGIPYKLGSGMKAYAVDTETDETCTLKDIGSEIPAKTPVVIACAGDNAADNKVTPLESSSASVGTNYLKGVMFCYPVFGTYQGQVTEIRENPYWNTVDYDNSTMRLLAAQDGKLVFKTAGEELDYMPANKAYLNVTSSSAATLSTTGSTFTAQTTEGIDMVFTILDESAKTCQVGYLDGSEDKPAVNREATGSVTIPKTVNDYTVVQIGQYAFYECSGLTSISIPNSVTTVEFCAFTRCSGLTTLTIPNSVTTIKGGGFFQCSSLTSLTIPKSVTTIGHEAFSYCYGLTSLNVEAGNTKYDSRDNCNAIIETATNKLVSGTKNTIIPNSVTAIGNEAFLGCTGLTSITIPNSVTTIEDGAFHGCYALVSIIIPKSVTTIGILPFVDCHNLNSLNVEAGNTKYDSRDNCNAVIETSTNAIVAGCPATTIPTTVTEIGSYVFCGLYNCTIHLHSDIDKIGDYAFWNCNGLILDVEKTTPLTINENVFEGLSNSTLKVPAGSKSAYAEATGWNKFSTILESTFTAQTTEGIDMVFTILDESAKTCQVGYLDGSWDKTAVDKENVKGPVTIPGTVEGYNVVKIGKCALNNVDGMTSITIPNTVTSIDDYAFCSCDGLTSFELPASVTSLGEGALSSIWNVTSLTVAAGNTTFDSRDNCNAIIEKATNKIVAGCQTTIIPANVTGIGTLAFDLSRGSIYIPSTVSTIEERAFICKNVTIQVERTTPLEINENVFDDNMTNSALLVPEGCRSAYAEATGWSKFGMILEGNEGSTFTAKTTENWDMVFTILDDNAKTCQVGYLDGAWDKTAVDNDVVEGPVTIPETVNDGYTVVKIGRYAFQNTLKMTSITIPNTVTGIGNSAFGGCWGMTNLEIPASVTSIGDDAFYGISKASSISVKEGNTKYDSRNNCNAIIETATNKLLFGCKNTIIPSTVTEIGREAFAGLNNCTLTIPSTITKIGEIAFSDCLNTTIQVEHTVPLNIDVSVFQELNNSTLRVPAGSKSAYAAATGWSKFGADNIIEDNKVTLENVTAGQLSTLITNDEKFNITDLTITGQLNGTDFRLLREMAGNDYTGHLTEGKLHHLDLSGVNIVEGGDNYLDTNEGITLSNGGSVPNSYHWGTNNNSLGSDLFIGCDKLEEIVLPNSITSIGGGAFAHCNNLKSLIIPKNVSSIGLELILNCNISSLSVAAGNQTFSSPEGSNVLMQGTKLVYGCKTSNIPSTTTVIGDGAFKTCANLGEVTIPEGVTTIERYAFLYSGLTAINLPSTLETIGDNAFAECSNLTSVTVGTETPLEITANVFTNRANATLYVPAGSKTAYQAADYWKEFKEIVEVEAPSGNIVFASPEVKAACVAKWDTNGDGELSYAEAAAVTSLVDPKDFEDPFALLMDVESDFTFDEFQYFTGVTSLTNYDFDEFEHLTSIVLPNSIQSIEGGAFYDCKLTSIHIPASVTDISDTYINESVIEVLYTPAFSSSFLQTITVDPENAKYSSPTGSNVIIDKTSNTLIMGCRNTDFSKIPNTVTTIAMRAFEGVEFANPAVNLPTSVEAIKAYAFNYSNIISINLGELTRLTEIGLTAFKDCDGLTEVTLPASITTMERAIFAGCDNIVKVVSNREEPLTNNNNDLLDHIIAIYNNAVLYVPSGKVEAYTNAGWEEPFEDDLKSFRVITDGDHTDPEAIEGLAYNGSDQKLILPGTYRTGMMEYSLDGTNYSTSVPTGKEAGEYTVYYRKVGESVASTLTATIALSSNIVFANDKVKAACVAKWDTDKDGELSYDEAAAVTSLVDKNDANDPFAQLWELGTENSEFSFDEFQYFTGVTSLVGHEFECTNLTSIILPNSITSIGDGTFVLCKKLTSIHIPASVTYIHMGDDELPAPAFNPKYLQTITVDPENTKYASPAGSNVIIDTETNTLILGCGNTVFTKVPNTVTTIGRNAFESVTFTNPIVSLPTSVTKIERDAFRGSNITSINLGELSNLTTIGTQAFSYCTGLTEVTLPASIRPWRLNEVEEGIGTSVFANCYNIVKVVSNIEEPFNNDNHSHTLYYYIFAIENDAVLYVPEGTVQAYIDKGWKEIDGDVQSFRVITDGDYTPPVAREGLVYGDYDIWMDPNKEGQRLIYPGAYRDGMMEYSLDGSTYSTSVPTGKEAGEYTVYYRKVGLSDASILKVTIAAPKTISVFSGSNLWAGYVATENLAIPTGLEAYVITNLGATTATASSLNYIPQGIPVLLKRNNASVNDYEISTGTGTAPTVNLLKTYDSDKSVSNREGFILYNDEFVLVNEGTLPAGRVFLPANGSGRALTRTIVFDRDDIVDFGDSQENNDDSNQWYDIQGRKLERKPTKKGIYILDGRKVVIK